MNKQSNVYTIIYIVVMVILVGMALAFTAMSLKDRQQANADADKMRQILAAVHIAPEKGQNVIELYKQTITSDFIVNSKGEKVEGDAFKVDVQKQSKDSDIATRLLPVYVCTLSDGQVKYILPAFGAGLWGPIWGYIAVDADGSTVYGAYFSHQGETPGLGAMIAEPAFYDQFNSHLHLIKDGKMMPIEVIKKGQKPLTDADYVDGVSGGTITSKGVGDMLNNCLKPYETFLKSLSNK